MALASILGAAGALTVPSTVAADPRVAHASGLAVKKAPGRDDGARAPAPDAPLLATLVQTHTDERVLLDAAEPDAARPVGSFC